MNYFVLVAFSTFALMQTSLAVPFDDGSNSAPERDHNDADSHYNYDPVHIMPADYSEDLLGKFDCTADNLGSNAEYLSALITTFIVTPNWIGKYVIEHLNNSIAIKPNQLKPFINDLVLAANVYAQISAVISQNASAVIELATANIHSDFDIRDYLVSKTHIGTAKLEEVCNDIDDTETYLSAYIGMNEQCFEDFQAMVVPQMTTIEKGLEELTSQCNYLCNDAAIAGIRTYIENIITLIVGETENIMVNATKAIATLENCTETNAKACETYLYEKLKKFQATLE